MPSSFMDPEHAEFLSMWEGCMDSLGLGGIWWHLEDRVRMSFAQLWKAMSSSRGLRSIDDSGNHCKSA